MKGKIIKQLLIGIFVVLLGCSSSQRPDFSIGIDPTFYPLNFDKKAINAFAFINELFAEIEKMNKTTVQRLNGSWDNLFDGLETGDYNGVISSMQPRVFNESVYVFSDIILPTGPVIVVPIYSDITSYSDLGDKIVAVEDSSQAALKLTTDLSVSMRTYDSIAAALNDLNNGRYDAVLVDVVPAVSYVRDLYSNSLKIVGEPILPLGLRVVGLNGDANKMVDMVNRSIKKLKEKGKYQQLIKKWNVGV